MSVKQTVINQVGQTLDSCTALLDELVFRTSQNLHATQRLTVALKALHKGCLEKDSAFQFKQSVVVGLRASNLDQDLNKVVDILKGTSSEASLYTPPETQYIQERVCEELAIKINVLVNKLKTQRNELSSKEAIHEAGKVLRQKALEAAAVASVADDNTNKPFEHEESSASPEVVDSDEDNAFEYEENEGVFSMMDEVLLVGGHPRYSRLDTRTLRSVFLEAAERGETAVIQAIMNSDRCVEISANKLGRAFVYAADNGNTNIIELIRNSPRFAEISAEDLGTALYFVACNGNVNIIEMIINSPRFAEISVLRLEEAFAQAARGESPEIVQMIINSPRFAEISAKSLGYALTGAACYGRYAIAKIIINSPRFIDIFPEDIDTVFKKTCQGSEDCVEIVRTIVNSMKFSDISIQSLESIFGYAAHIGRTDIVEIIINSSRFPEISRLGSAFHAAARAGNTGIIRMLVNSTRFRDIPKEDLGNSLQIAACLRRVDIVEIIINSSRFSDIPAECLVRTFTHAFFSRQSNIVQMIINSSRFNEISEDYLRQLLAENAADAEIQERLQTILRLKTRKRPASEE